MEFILGNSSLFETIQEAFDITSNRSKQGRGVGLNINLKNFIMAKIRKKRIGGGTFCVD